MLYQQFNRVCELDTQILTLHQTLADLYAERATLLQVQLPGRDVASGKKITTITNAATYYEELAATWRTRHAIALPSKKLIGKKLEQACKIVDRLVAEHPQLLGKAKLVAVPPFATLKKIMAKAAEAQTHTFVFADEDVLHKISKSKSWSFVIVIDQVFSMQVSSVQELMEGHALKYQAYDCCGLGVQELIAAELQGIKAASEDGWTLLPKDASDQYVPCAKRLGERIVFDVDDADCLLDDNFLQPAIQAA